MAPNKPIVETEVETKTGTATKISIGVMIFAGVVTMLAIIAAMLNLK